jgi:hypothetical protein
MNEDTDAVEKRQNYDALDDIEDKLIKVLETLTDLEVELKTTTTAKGRYDVEGALKTTVYNMETLVSDFRNAKKKFR